MKKKQQTPALRFSPHAWAKLLFLRDISEAEVGGFGISDADDLLFVVDIALVKQKVTDVSVAFDDDSVANLFDDQVESGKKPQQFARIWLHTHPGSSPQPSCTDESTFKRVFGNCDWSVMAIVSQNTKTYARMHLNNGSGWDLEIPVSVDYDCEFEGSDIKLWRKQYKQLVSIDDTLTALPFSKKGRCSLREDVFGSDGLDNINDTPDLLEQIDILDPMEREYLLEELAIRSEFWDESEVLYE